MMFKIRKITRKCLVCGKSIRIKVYEDGHYNKGYYFKKLKIPIGKGEFKKIRTTKIGKRKIDVVKWAGKEKEIEYWECNDCFEESSHECWLEEKLVELYGKKCRDYEKECACCEAWSIYNPIIQNNRGKL